jgi:hypothetical protein
VEDQAFDKGRYQADYLYAAEDYIFTEAIKFKGHWQQRQEHKSQTSAEKEADETSAEKEADETGESETVAADAGDSEAVAADAGESETVAATSTKISAEAPQPPPVASPGDAAAGETGAAAVGAAGAGAGAAGAKGAKGAKGANGAESDYQFSEEEQEQLRSLPHKKDYRLLSFDAGAEYTCLCGLVSVLIAYAYDKITTQGTPSCESDWTVATLSQVQRAAM